MNVTPLKIAKQELSGSLGSETRILRENTVTHHPQPDLRHEVGAHTTSFSAVVFHSFAFVRAMLVPLVPGAASRLFIGLLLVFACGLTFEKIPARENNNYQAAFNSSRESLVKNLRVLFSSADALWYQQIAQTGYDRAASPSDEAHNWVFFPVYPLLLKGVAVAAHHATGHPQFGFGFLPLALAVNTAAFLLSLLLIYRFAILKGLDNRQAERSIWLLSFFPLSYFFICPLTEAPFLFLLSATLVLSEQRKFLAAAVCMCLAASCRPVGMLMLPAFALLLLEKRAYATARGWIALAIAPLGIFAFMGYLLLLTGDPFAFLYNQSVWGRGQQSFATLAASLIALESPLILPWNFVVLNLASGLLSLACGLWLLRKKEAALAAFVILPIAFSAATGTLQSLGRFTATLVPVFLVLSVWCDNPRVERTVFAILIALLTLMTLGFAFQVTAAMA